MMEGVWVAERSAKGHALPRESCSRERKVLQENLVRGIVGEGDKERVCRINIADQQEEIKLLAACTST